MTFNLINITKNGKSIGIDSGIKKLMYASDNKIYDVGLEKIYNKINRSRKGSKGRIRALAHRDNASNQSVNQIDTTGIDHIVVEDLKNLKTNKQMAKKTKQFRRALMFWSYPKVLDKIMLMCENRGILFEKVYAAYSSRTCSKCGHNSAKNRSGEQFLCTSCGFVSDADYNASLVIERRGAYSPSIRAKLST